MAPPEVIEIPPKVAAPEKKESDYDFVVDRTFRYTGGNLTSAFTDGAAQGKMLVFFTGSAKMPGIQAFLTKQVPALLSLPDSKDVLPVYIDLDKLKKDDPILMSLAKKADADSPQILIVNLKPGRDKKPVLDLDSLVTVTGGNQEKSAQLLEKLALLLKAAKRDIVSSDKFDLPKAEDKAAKVLPKVELVDNEEAERKAMEGLAKLFVIQQKEREAAKKKDLARQEAARAAEIKRYNGETHAIYKKYPHLEGFNEDKRSEWLDDNFPLINYAKFRAAFSKAYEDASSVWNDAKTNRRKIGEATDKVYRERDNQWNELLKLASKDTARGHKAYLVLCDIMKKRGYPKYSEDRLSDWCATECAEVIADRCAPGKPNRDLACWVLGNTLRFYGRNYKDADKLYKAFKDLAIPDEKGVPAPLTKDQMRFSIEHIFFLNASRGEAGHFGIMYDCIDDLKSFNNPDSLFMLDRVPQGKGVDGSIKKKLSDLIAHLRRDVSDRWTEQVPEPFRKEKDRAADLKAALDKQLPNLADNVKSTASDEIVTAIARNYKFYQHLSGKSDSIEQLKRVLTCKDAASRIAAARVFLSSDLPEDNADRIKATLSLIELTLDKASGGRFRQEAYTLLDGIVPDTGSTKIGDYKLAKEGDLGLVIEDKKRNWYTVTDDGDLERHNHVSYSTDGSFHEPGKLTLEENTIKAEYRKGSRVISRTGTFDGDDLKEMTWTEVGRFGPFIAKRKKEGGKYVDKYTVTIPSTSENGLSTDVEVEGKFSFRRDGSFRYSGQDWLKKTTGRINLAQEIGDLGVRQYTTR
jgi:hypothetical protein